MVFSGFPSLLPWWSTCYKQNKLIKRIISWILLKNVDHINFLFHRRETKKSSHRKWKYSVKISNVVGIYFNHKHFTLGHPFYRRSLDTQHAFLHWIVDCEISILIYQNNCWRQRQLFKYEQQFIFIVCVPTMNG